MPDPEDRPGQDEKRSGRAKKLGSTAAGAGAAAAGAAALFGGGEAAAAEPDDAEEPFLLGADSLQDVDDGLDDAGFDLDDDLDDVADDLDLLQEDSVTGTTVGLGHGVTSHAIEDDAILGAEVDAGSADDALLADPVGEAMDDGFDDDHLDGEQRDDDGFDDVADDLDDLDDLDLG